MKFSALLLLLVLSAFALNAQDQGKIDSLKLILKSLPALSGNESDTLRMKTSMLIGKQYERTQPDSAMKYYNSVIDTGFFSNDQQYNEAIKNKSRQILNANCLYLLGLLYVYKGDYQSSQSLWIKSEKIFYSLNDKYGASKCLNGLSNIAWNQGNYPKSIEHLEKSLQLKQEINDAGGISYALNNLGLIVMYQGNYKKANEYFENSLTMAEKLNDKKLISTCLINLGLVSANQEEIQKSIAFYERSLNIAEEIKDKKLISNVLGSIGSCYYQTSDFDKAFEYNYRALNIKEELKDRKGIATCYKNIGNVEYRKKEFTKALEYYKKSIQIKEDLGSLADLAVDLPVMAKVYINLDSVPKALPLLLRSNDITIWMLRNNFSVLNESERELFINQTKQIFNDFHAFNLKYPLFNDSLSDICYNNELIIKSLLLKSTVAVNNAVFNNPNPELKETFLLMKQYRNQISSLQGSAHPTREATIADLENKANELEQKLVRLSSDFAGLSKLFDNRWTDVQKNLLPDEAAIEFISYNSDENDDNTNYAALLITPNTKHPISVFLFSESELEKIIGKDVKTSYKYINELYSLAGNDLYNMIWKPLEVHLKDVKTIYFAPVGILNKTSFAALNDGTKLLCDKYNLQQVSTTGILINQNNFEFQGKFSATIFGGIDYSFENKTNVSNYSTLDFWQYLPGTLAEIEQIEKQFKKSKINYTSFSGKEAKEDVFKSVFDHLSPSIIHISTHGFFYPDPEEKSHSEKDVSGDVKFRGSAGFGNWMFVNNKNPMMRSGLVFSGANKVWSQDWEKTNNDGVLTAYEVSNLNMQNTALVVLSACETGLGDIKGSEGVYGLQRAFKMAGARYLVMSLWQVPDKETAEFMTLFYSKLIKLKDIRNAFNETQKEMQAKYDPYFWAAFVLVE